MLGVLAGAGLIHSSLGKRHEKEMKVDLGGSTTPFSLKERRKAMRRIP
jgi:hypothetical protein